MIRPIQLIVYISDNDTKENVTERNCKSIWLPYCVDLMVQRVRWGRWFRWRWIWRCESQNPLRCCLLLSSHSFIICFETYDQKNGDKKPGSEEKYVGICKTRNEFKINISLFISCDVRLFLSSAARQSCWFIYDRSLCKEDILL